MISFGVGGRWPHFHRQCVHSLRIVVSRRTGEDVKGVQQVGREGPRPGQAMVFKACSLTVERGSKN